VLIAGVINKVLHEQHVDPLTVVRVAACLSDVFGNDSPRFQNDLFINECLKGQEK
jgi:hypothetical protein